MIPLGIPALYMKKYLLCAIALLLPTVLRAQDFIRIDHVGLGSSEILSVGNVTPVRVHIPVQPQAQTLQLEFQFETGDKNDVRRKLLPHRFMKQVQAFAGAPSDVDVPLYLPTTPRLQVNVSVTDASGHQIGSGARNLDQNVRGGGQVIAIYCLKEEKCDQLASQVNSGFDDEERAANAKSDTKTKISRTVITLKDLFDHWWDYGAVDSVVVAGPTSDLSGEKRNALEQYLRLGGALVILESDLSDRNFLAAYRLGPLSRTEIPIGMGRLTRLSGLDGTDLRKTIASTKKSPITVLNDAVNTGAQSDDFFLNRTGITFTFPRLRWLLIWFGIFIVVVGPLNFFILRRLRRLEWGWVTTTAIAVLFAGGLYVVNSVSRPKEFMLDDAAMYRMDDRSPLASAVFGFRVYSPERRDIILSVNQNSIPYDMNANRSFGDSGLNIGSGFAGPEDTSIGWRVHLDSPLQFYFPMLRWSTEDFSVRGFREFAGTVHWTSDMHLKNDTGQNFREAIYMDFKANKKYLISRLASGEEVNLNSINPAVIFDPKEMVDENNVNSNVRNLAHFMNTERLPFSVSELPYEKLQYLKDSQVFAGWTEGQPLNASLDTSVAPHTGRALVIVTMQNRCAECPEKPSQSK
jgi:hypothetical protein